MPKDDGFTKHLPCHLLAKPILKSDGLLLSVTDTWTDLPSVCLEYGLLCHSLLFSGGSGSFTTVSGKHTLATIVIHDPVSITLIFRIIKGMGLNKNPWNFLKSCWAGMNLRMAQWARHDFRETTRDTICVPEWNRDLEFSSTIRAPKGNNSGTQ